MGQFERKGVESSSNRPMRLLTQVAALITLAVFRECPALLRNPLYLRSFPL